MNIKNSINQAFRETITTTTTASKQVEFSTPSPTTASKGNEKIAYIYCTENNCSLIIGGYSFAALTIVFCIYLILTKSGKYLTRLNLFFKWDFARNSPIKKIEVFRST